jgi:hypothetical protein
MSAIETAARQVESPHILCGEDVKARDHRHQGMGPMALLDRGFR